MENVRQIFGDSIEYANDPYDAITNVDALLIVTEWIEFRFPKYKLMQKLMAKHVIFDGRNIFDRNEVKKAGFEYYCIGANVNSH